jgi:hypothetical protein
MRCTAGLVILLMTVIAAPTAALSCMPVTDAVAAQMMKKHHEEIVATGTVPQGAVVIAASRSGSFTILLKRNHGLPCVAAAGKDWDQVNVSIGEYF